MAQDDRIEFISRYLDEVGRVLAALPLAKVARALEVVESACRQDKQIFLAGNGGSAATAQHMASDLVWSVRGASGPGFRAIALTENVPLLTAVANDTDFAEVFARPLETLARPGDVLLVISGSGRSRNVVRAVETARARGLATVGFLGGDGGAVAEMLDVAVIVPADDYGPIEDVHLIFDHLFTAYLRQRLAGRAAPTVR